jgi:hypothetical protein
MNMAVIHFALLLGILIWRQQKCAIRVSSQTLTVRRICKCRADAISMPSQSGYEITPHVTARSGKGERGRRFEDKDPGSTTFGPSPANNLERWRQVRLTENDNVAGGVRPLTRRNNDAERDHRSKTQEICHKT